MRVLVTGLTGFLGRHVAPLLSEVAEVTSLSRSDPKALNADLSFWDARIDPSRMCGKFDIMLHMAGLYNLRVSPIEARRQNIMTTHSALTIAQKAEIPQFIYTSTVAVAVRNKKILVFPDEFDDSIVYPDNYAFSKAYAEEMVRYWSDGVPSRLVLRLGPLVGDKDNGAIGRIDGPYYALETVKKLKSFIEKWPGTFPVPGKVSNRLPLVPVDCAAKAIVQLMVEGFKNPWPRYKALNLTPKEGLTAKDFYETILGHLGITKKFAFIENIPSLVSKYAAEWLIGFPKEEVEYLINLPLFDSTETRKILGENWCPEFLEYKEAFLRGYDHYVSNC